VPRTHPYNHIARGTPRSGFLRDGTVHEDDVHDTTSDAPFVTRPGLLHSQTHSFNRARVWMTKTMKSIALLCILGLLLAFPTIAAKPPLTPHLDRRARDSRLGSNFTTIPIWRTLGGTNVINIGLGGEGPGFTTQPMNLTLCELCGECERGEVAVNGGLTRWFGCLIATSINYLLVATLDCAGCVDGGLA
jgi:hypothetical protein